MLQTLQMIEMMGDLPETKIIGVVPYVIGEDTTFNITDEVQKAAELMEKILINELKKLGVKVKVKNENVKLTEIAKISYKRGVPVESLQGLTKKAKYAK
jgi:hydrogenase maturation protease